MKRSIHVLEPLNLRRELTKVGLSGVLTQKERKKKEQKGRYPHEMELEYSSIIRYYTYTTACTNMIMLIIEYFCGNGAQVREKGEGG